MLREYHMIVFIFVILFFATSIADRGSQPKIMSPYQKDHWLTSGDTLRLICPVESDPAPIVTWKKDGDDIHIGWERFRTREDLLMVKGVEPGDSGIYVCLATNGFGTVSVQYSVCVSGNDTDWRTSFGVKDVACNFNGNGEMPSFVNLHEMKDQYIQLIEGESAQLDCQAVGKPRPEIRWFKDGREKLHSHNSAGNNWMLTLNDAAIDDTGHYTCNVYNRVGSVNYTYIVKVSSKLVNVPEFRVSVLKNVTAVAGTIASFHCEAYSDIETRIQWLRQVPSSKEKRNPNYTIVMEDKHFMVIQRGQTQAHSEGRYLSKLTIYPVGLNDSGTYVCSAANSYGFRLQSASLSVVPGKKIGDGDLTRVDFDGVTQFLPIVATIVSIFLVLLLGIVAYFVFRRCLRSDGCSAPSHQCSPSSVSSFPVQRTNVECQYDGFVPLKHHQHLQLLSPGTWMPHGHHGGSLTSDAIYVSACGAPKHLSSSVVQQREELLHSHQSEHFQF